MNLNELVICSSSLFVYGSNVKGLQLLFSITLNYLHYYIVCVYTVYI